MMIAKKNSMQIVSNNEICTEEYYKCNNIWE